MHSPKGRESHREVDESSVVVQSHKLISHACENKRVLFEPRQESFPYHLRTAIRFHAAPVGEIESYLNEILTANQELTQLDATSDNFRSNCNGSSNGHKENSRRDFVGESHKKFLRAAEKLRKNSNSVNDSLCFVISTYDKNNAAAEDVMNQHIAQQQLQRSKSDDDPAETFETY